MSDANRCTLYLSDEALAAVAYLASIKWSPVTPSRSQIVSAAIVAMAKQRRAQMAKQRRAQMAKQRRAQKEVEE
jgi:hypothetical protein